MKEEVTKSSTRAKAIPRRDFLAGSAAVVASLAIHPGISAIAQPAKPAQRGFSDTALKEAHKRAAALVKQMTLEEVVSQTVNRTPAIPRLGVPGYNYWTEGLHGVAVDGPVTSFPQPIALGCSWNPQLVHAVYNAVSDEARAYHNKTGHPLAFFSPATVNMGLRDPRWGRVNENFSEDPWLVQTLAVQTVRAMQGDHDRYLKTIACAKHFICNDTDTDRRTTNAMPDKRSFWEYFTRGFEAAVRQGQVFSVMAAYNSVWGKPCPANEFILTEVLRNRWEFKGYVVSDCDAIADIYRTHHYVETPSEAAALAVKAGSDLNCGQTLSQSLMEAIEKKLVTEEAVRTALTRALTGRFLLGEFDPQEAVPWTNISPSILEDKPHRELAREAARQSLVLLKNDGHLLPLKKPAIKSIAVIGPMAGSCHLGGYSGSAVQLVSPYAGIAAAMGVPLFTDRVPAGEYLNTSNVRGPVVDFAEDGQQTLSKIPNNSWAQYGPLQFAGKTSIEFEVASQTDATILVHLDSLSEAPVVTVSVPATGGTTAWKTVSADLPAIPGEHVIFLRFTAGNNNSLLTLRSFRLLPAAKAPESAVKVTFAPGCSITGAKIDALFNQAVKAAAQADVALVFVGDNRLLSDEGHDRSELALPGAQQQLIDAVSAANPRTVVIINSACPVSFDAKAPAVLCALNNGQEQGHAIADALFGAYNPGGKLCSTWFQDVSQLPDFHDYDIKHGNTYMYFRGKPLYPFGYGLSYTSFAYKNLRVESEQLQPGKSLRLTVEVTNTGAVAGDEVVQFYVHAESKVQRPALQLAGYQRVPLKPGETQRVTFSLPHDHLALRYWDEAKNDFTYDPGTVELLIGSSSADIHLRGKVNLV